MDKRSNLTAPTIAYGKYRTVTPHLSLGKLSPPPPPRDAVVRRGLLDTLIESEISTTILMAPAGFGKTILMAQLHCELKARNHPVAWLSLDDRDNDFSRFVIYIREAIQRLELFPQPQNSVASDAHDSVFSDLRAESYELIDCIASTPLPFTLLIDDFEAIHSPDVTTFFTELVRSFNPGQALVIGSRSMRTIPLASLEVRGQVHRLGAENLVFDLHETASFFHNQGQLQLSKSDIANLQQKTEGWAAALRLVTFAIPGVDDTSAWIANLSGRTDSITQYLIENVLARLPEPLCRFLRESSVLEHLNGDLCDAVLDTEGSHRILDDLYRANLFLTPADPQNHSFEFHSLFRSFLIAELQRIQPKLIPILHRRAAVFLCSRTHYAEALVHAMRSGDSLLSVDILNFSALRFVGLGQLESVAKWIDAIDPLLISDRANIQRARAYAMIALHRYTDAQDALAKLQHMAMAQGNELDAEATMQLALLYEWMDRHDLSESEVVRMAEKIPPKNNFAYGISKNLMAYLKTAKLDYIGAQQALDAAKLSYQDGGLGIWPSTYTTCFEGILEMILGNGRGAIQRFEAALSLASNVNQSIPSAYLADSLYGRADLLRAGSLAEEHLQLNRHVAPPDIVILSYRTAARVNFINGNLDLAELLLTELGDVGDMRDIARLKASAWLEKSRIALLCGDSESAFRYFTLGANPKIWGTHKNFHFYPQEIDDPTIASMRMALVLGDAEVAAQEITSAIKDSDRTGRRWRRIRLQCLLAQAYSRLRKRKQAIELLVDALREAERNEHIYVFADEPWHLLDLLEEIAQQKFPIGAEYLDRVIGTTRQMSQGIGELITSKKQSNLLSLKETAILKLVADGKANKEIARILNISENTVETHLRRINQKCDTKNRTQAVTSAREMGLLR